MAGRTSRRKAKAPYPWMWVEREIRKLYARNRTFYTLAQSSERRLQDEAICPTFPNWRETLQTEEFRDWFAVQPRKVRDLGRSYDPKDAMVVLSRFDAWRKKVK